MPLKFSLPMFNRSGDARATDPVCDMKVDMRKPPGGTFDLDGETYYFCALGCNRAFRREPQAYLSGEKKIEM